MVNKMVVAFLLLVTEALAEEVEVHEVVAEEVEEVVVLSWILTMSPPLSCLINNNSKGIFNNNSNNRSTSLMVASWEEEEEGSKVLDEDVAEAEVVVEVAIKEGVGGMHLQQLLLRLHTQVLTFSEQLSTLRTSLAAAGSWGVIIISYNNNKQAAWAT